MVGDMPAGALGKRRPPETLMLGLQTGEDIAAEPAGVLPPGTRRASGRSPATATARRGPSDGAAPPDATGAVPDPGEGAVSQVDPPIDSPAVRLG